MILCTVKMQICLLFISIFFLNSCNGQVTTISNSPLKMKRTQNVASANVGCELKDKTGNLWFSAEGEGIYLFDGKSFVNFTTKDGLPSNYINDIIQDKSGNILIGTGAGICRYDGEKFKKYFEADSLNQFGILSLMEDRDGNLWFSVFDKGIYKYDGKHLSNILHWYEHPFFANKKESFISDIIQDKNGNVWFSSFNRGGVWRYNEKALTQFLPSASYYSSNENEGSTTNFFSLTRQVHSSDYINDDMINDMSEDKAGNIWFATRRHGACRFDGNVFIGFDEKDGFVSYGVKTIATDKNGIIWLGTEKNGVFAYDGKTFKNFTTADGLVNNSVCSILEDNEGNMWFGTRWFGLSRYDGKTFTTFSE